MKPKYKKLFYNYFIGKIRLNKPQEEFTNLLLKVRNRINKNIIKDIIKINHYRGMSLKKIKAEYEKIDNSVEFSVATLRRLIKDDMNYRYSRPKIKIYLTLTNEHFIMIQFFIKHLITLLEDNCTLIYLDESGFNNNNQKLKEWIGPNEMKKNRIVLN
jgi:hypothetical protein